MSATTPTAAVKKHARVNVGGLKWDMKEFESHSSEGNPWLGPRTVKDNSSVKS
jgi:hypothetical protein